MAPVQAVLLGWLAVALWNAGDIARMPVRPKGLAVRAVHHVVDLGHVLAVALLIAGAVAIWTRLGPRKRIWSAIAVAVAAAVVSPIVLSEDLEGVLERLLPENQRGWLLPGVCVAVGQAVTACFVVGRWCARPRLRRVAVGASLALLVAHDFILKTGYPGAHVLLSASAATLLASCLTGAPCSWLEAVARRLKRRASIVWAVAALFAAFTVVRKPSSALQVEFLERDTSLLFPWLRPLYAPSRIGNVAIPPKLRHSFESRARRPDLPSDPRRFLPEGPIVVMITIDALRYDILEPRYRQVAPNLHEIRASSVYFAQARSSGSDTRFSLGALFTGRHYSMLKWKWPKSGRRPTLEHDHLPRLPELLQKAGVQTVTALAVDMLEPKHGIVRGFTESLPVTFDPKYRSSSDEISEKMIERLRRQGPGPLFIYTHLMDPHDPYETHGRPAKSEFDAYLMEVSVADENVGRIRRAIAELGLKQRTALMIASDHGEGFGEHRIFTHGRTVYDVMVHIPLMIEIPGVAPRSVDDFVSLMDFGPTVLDVFGLPTPGYWMSESLTPFLARGRGNPNRVLLMEKPREKAMLFPDGLKVMNRRGTYQLYDVIRDPEEKNNLWEQLPEEGPRRLALLKTYIQIHSLNGGVDPGRDDE